MKYVGNGDWRNLGKIRGKWQIMGCPDVIMPNSPKDGFCHIKRRKIRFRAEDDIFQ